MHLGYIAVREHYGRVGKLIKEHHEKRKPRPKQNILYTNTARSGGSQRNLFDFEAIKPRGGRKKRRVAVYIF